MPFYDQDTISEFAAAKGHQIWPFVSNTDDPSGDPAHPDETANFLVAVTSITCIAVLLSAGRLAPGRVAPRS